MFLPSVCTWRRRSASERRMCAERLGVDHACAMWIRDKKHVGVIQQIDTAKKGSTHTRPDPCKKYFTVNHWQLSFFTWCTCINIHMLYTFFITLSFSEEFFPHLFLHAIHSFSRTLFTLISRASRHDMEKCSSTQAIFHETTYHSYIRVWECCTLTLTSYNGATVATNLSSLFVG